MRFDHLMDWNNSKISNTEAHYSKRLTSEAWFINSHPHVMNRSAIFSRSAITVISYSVVW